MAIASAMKAMKVSKARRATTAMKATNATHCSVPSAKVHFTTGVPKVQKTGRKLKKMQPKPLQSQRGLLCLKVWDHSSKVRHLMAENLVMRLKRDPWVPFFLSKPKKKPLSSVI